MIGKGKHRRGSPLASTTKPSRKYIAKRGEVADIAESIKGKISRLADLVANGNQASAVAILSIACLATERLNDLARRKADLFGPIAAGKTSWPVMWGPHPEVIEQNKAFAQHLTLGSKTGINFPELGKPFSLQVPANRIAMYLMRLTHALRRAPTSDWDETENSLLSSMGRFEGHYSVKYALQQLDDLEVWGRRTAKHLPALSRATLKEWKQPIREVFRLVYGETFDEHPHLQKLKDAVLRHADASGRQVPGIVREAMLKKVLQALHSIAPLG